MQTSICIVVAMESERKHLDALMPGWEREEDPIWPMWRQGDILTITCGIGMVAAAAATQYVISRFAPKYVLNFGCTGAHMMDIHLGDVVIGDHIVNHGLMRFAPNGSIIPLTIGFHVPGETESVTQLNSDPRLLSIAQSVAEKLDLPIWPEEPDHPRSTHEPAVHTGTVSSGDIWKQDPVVIRQTHELTGSLCEDMEAASIAQICAMHRVPFLTVKDISNNELHRSTIFEGSTSELHSDELGLRAAMVLSRVIRVLVGETSEVTRKSVASQS